MLQHCEVVLLLMYRLDRGESNRGDGSEPESGAMSGSIVLGGGRSRRGTTSPCSSSPRATISGWFKSTRGHHLLVGQTPAAGRSPGFLCFWGRSGDSVGGRGRRRDVSAGGLDDVGAEQDGVGLVEFCGDAVVIFDDEPGEEELVEVDVAVEGLEALPSLSELSVESLLFALEQVHPIPTDAKLREVREGH